MEENNQNDKPDGTTTEVTGTAPVVDTPAFKVRSVDSNSATTDPVDPVTPPPPVPPVDEPDEVDEPRVISFFEKKFGKKVENLEDLFKTPEPTVVEKEPELPQDVAAFYKYAKETGRGLSDFMKIQKDHRSMDHDQVLFEYYSVENPYLTPDEIRDEIRDQFGYDDQVDDERDISRKQRAKKIKVEEAINRLSSLKEQYNAPLESRGLDVPEEEKQMYEDFKSFKETEAQHEAETAKKKDVFTQKTLDLFSPSFEGFEFKVGESNSVVYKPADAETLKRDQMSLGEFIQKRFLDENGYLKDATLFHRALSIAADPDRFANFFYEKGKTDFGSSLEEESKNLDLNPKRPVETVQTTGFKVRALD